MPMNSVKVVSVLVAMVLFTACSSTTGEGKMNNENLNLKIEAAATENINQSNSNTTLSTSKNQNLNESIPQILTYKGTWFTINYPASFIVRQTLASADAQMNDEAFFTSSDKSVEFYIYSPQWGGEPAYMKVATNEKLADTKKETKGEGLEKTTTTWMTMNAKDGSYTRSLVSIRQQVDTGSDLHHVFGIKYKDQASYEKYKDAYVAFKKSLEQFADGYAE